MTQPIKDQARLLAQHLKAAHGITLKHGQALNALSAALGYTDWNSAKAQGITDGRKKAAHTPYPHALMDVTLTAAAAQKWLDQTAIPSGMEYGYPVVTDFNEMDHELLADNQASTLDYLRYLLTLAYHPREDPHTYFGSYWLARGCLGDEDIPFEDLLIRMADIMRMDDDGPGRLDSWADDLLLEDPLACYERLVQHAQEGHDVIAVRVFITKTYAFTALCTPHQLPQNASPTVIDRGPYGGDRQSF